MRKAVFSAGCFWGVEAAFRKVPGVITTTVGYAGGTLENPTYEQVSTGRTGHAQSVRIEYDPAQISYSQLLEVFWNIHDPTTLDRQGPDIGSQYRSAVFFEGADQEAAARESKERLESIKRYWVPIVTEIIPLSDFYPAEDHHQQYYEKRGLR